MDKVVFSNYDQYQQQVAQVAFIKKLNPMFAIRDTLETQMAELEKPKREKNVAMLRSLGATEESAAVALKIYVKDFERRLKRIDELKDLMIDLQEAMQSLVEPDIVYALRLVRAKKRKAFLMEIAAKGNIPLSVIADAAKGAQIVDAEGNVDWTQARKVQERAQSAVDVYDYDKIENDLANRGIYLRDLGIRSATKTPEEARRVMAQLKAKGVALSGPAELGNLAMLFDWWSQTSSQNHEREMQDRQEAENRRQEAENRRQERLGDWNEVAGWFGGAERTRLNPALLGQITIQAGSKGAVVRVWQEFLISRGYALPKYGADSDFGAETISATMKFQRDQKIGVDGIVGPETWSAMERLTSPTAPPAPSSTPTASTTSARKTTTTPATGLRESGMPAWLLPGALTLGGIGIAVALRNQKAKKKAKR